MNVLKRFLKYYKPHMRLFVIDMICALLVAGCDLVYPVITKNIIDDYVPNKQIRTMLIFCGVLLLIYAVKAALNFIILYWGHIMGVGIQADMRRDMFVHLEKLPFSFFDENKTGSIMSRIVNDLMEISELAHHCPEDLFISMIMLIGSFVILITINIPLTLIVFSVIPFIVLFAWKMRKKMKDAFRLSREKIAEVNADVERSLSGVRITRSYAAEDHEIENFDSSNKEFVGARRKAYKAMGEFHSVMNFLTDMLYLVVLIAAGVFFYKKLIGIGDFIAYLLYISMFLKPINRLMSFFEQYQDGMTGLNRFMEIMDTEPEKDDENAIDPGKLNGDIRFDKVCFSYSPDSEHGSEGAEPFRLSDFDLTIPRGKKIALVGQSGGGKSTICHLIPRFYEIESGSISIDGYDIRTLKRQALRKKIGIVAQDVFLFNGTIKDNIAYGKADATDEEIIAAAKSAKIHDYITTLPDGYETNVGERGIKLSGGQKQRISIARVFLKNPPILILDEATSALDNITEAAIQRELDSLGKGRTLLTVAHRLTTIRDADEIIVVTPDGIAERGTHEELVALGGEYAKLYNRSE
ncbi:MAG: ABC transporter ATP-binding protein [Clostridia bacterium]|nr:ABC transporter ATP-binding protein [Clostridia bacterium]